MQPQAADRPTIAAIWRAIMRSRKPSNGTVKVVSPRGSPCQASRASRKCGGGSASPSARTTVSRTACSVIGRKGMVTVSMLWSGRRRGAPVTLQHMTRGWPGKVRMAPMTRREDFEAARGAVGPALSGCKCHRDAPCVIRATTTFNIVNSAAIGPALAINSEIADVRPVAAVGLAGVSGVNRASRRMAVRG